MIPVPNVSCSHVFPEFCFLYNKHRYTHCSQLFYSLSYLFWVSTLYSLLLVLSFIHLPFPSSIAPTVPTFRIYWRQVLGYLMRHIAGNGMAFRWFSYEITSFCGFCCLEMFSWWAASIPAAYIHICFIMIFRCVLFMDAY